jgi:hypothetical protein
VSQADLDGLDQAAPVAALPAELEAIARQADAQLDQVAAPGAAPAAVDQAEPDQAATLEALLGLAVATLAPALPFLPACYTDEARRQIAVAGAAVCAKHGWTLDGLMSPELALAAVTIPPTIAAVVAGRAHFAAVRASSSSSSSSSSPSSSPAIAPPAPADPRPNAGERLMPRY